MTSTSFHTQGVRAVAVFAGLLAWSSTTSALPTSMVEESVNCYLNASVHQMREKARSYDKLGGDAFEAALWNKEGFGINAARAERAAAPYRAKAQSIRDQVAASIDSCMAQKQREDHAAVPYPISVGETVVLAMSGYGAVPAGIAGISAVALSVHFRRMFQILDRSMEAANRLADRAPSFSQAGRNLFAASSGMTNSQANTYATRQQQAARLRHSEYGGPTTRESYFKAERVAPSPTSGSSLFSPDTQTASPTAPAASATLGLAPAATTGEPFIPAGCPQTLAELDAQLASMPSAPSGGSCTKAKHAADKVRAVLQSLDQCPHLDEDGAQRQQFNEVLAWTENTIQSICTR